MSEQKGGQQVGPTWPWSRRELEDELRRLREENAGLLAEADATQLILTQAGRDQAKDREAMRVSLDANEHGDDCRCSVCRPLVERLEAGDK